jgi:small subunit ribosomal protein S3Ae
VKEWKEKKWIEVLAPPYFGGQKVGETVASEEGEVLGRVMEVSLADLTQDISKGYIKLKFKIDKVSEGKASTFFCGHEAMYDYFRSFVRRRLSKVQSILTVRTKDNYTLRISSVVLTQRKIQTSVERMIRKEMEKFISTRAGERTFDQFVQEMVLGKLAMDAYKEVKKYCPIRRIEIHKSKLLALPSD